MQDVNALYVSWNAFWDNRPKDTFKGGLGHILHILMFLDLSGGVNGVSPDLNWEAPQHRLNF